MTQCYNEATSKVCIITGSKGFVGYHLCPALKLQGWSIVPLSRSNVDFGNISALADFLRDHHATDIVHLAAESNPSAGNSLAFYENNALLTERLLEAAGAFGLPGRVIVTSATSVYGDGGFTSLTEDAPLRPLNHYGASKMLTETIAAWYRPKLDITIARPSNCIGQGQKPGYLLPKLVSAFALRQPDIFIGDQDIARDMVDIRDAVDIFCRVLASPARSIECVNVASGRATTIRDVITALSKLTSHIANIHRDERFIRKGDMRYQACDISRAKALGHKPEHSLEDTLSWMLSAQYDAMKQ